MENKRSLLICDHIDITDKIKIRIPSVREILENEQFYYSLITSLTATPYQYMVQLDDAGMDFTKVNDYTLFRMLFPIYGQTDMSILFGDLYTKDYISCALNDNHTPVLYSKKNGCDYIIDEFVYTKIVDAIRRINDLERVKYKAGNEAARIYLLEKARKKQKRNARKPYVPYLEKLIIALVNKQEFKYNYEQSLDLSIFKFTQSVKQIQHTVTFDKLMIGVYSGTVDTSKMADKSNLSWIQTK